MADEPTPNGGANPNPPTKDGEPSGGTNSANTGNTGGAFNPATLSDEQINKVLEDPRLWQTKRLTELRDAKKALDERQKADEEAEKKRLTEQGEFQKLNEKTQKELESANAKIHEMELKGQIMNSAIGKGIKDVDAALKLIDMSKITRNEDGTYAGLNEAIDALVTTRPYLVNSNVTVGNPTNPGNPSDATGQFTVTQISDSKFYNEHHAEIKKAQAEGKIVDDRQWFPKA